MSWRYIFWHAFTIRWHLLYVLKAGLAPSVDTPAWKAASFLVVNRSLNLLRSTWHVLRSPDMSRRRTQRFHTAMSWVMFPVMLPYMMFWDLRFRRVMRDRLLEPRRW